MSFKAGYHTISFLFILVSFVFLLFATISYPVVDVFALSKTLDNKYGIFGSCLTSNSDNCIVGYPLDFTGSIKDNLSGYLFMNDTRTTLAKIFVLAPIALGFDLILLIVIFVIHFGSRVTVLIGIFVNVLATIATIITCVVVILCFYPYVTWVPWTLVAAGAITFISLILLILSLTVVGNDDDDDDNDAKSNFDNEDFGRFTNYSRIDDKFNHIQTSTFKTSNSLDNDYEYKPHNNNNNNNNATTATTTNNVGSTNFTGGAMNKFSNPTNNSRGVMNGGSTTTGSGVGSGGTVISGMNPPAHKNGSLTSNSSSYYNNPQTATDFTQRNKPNAYQPSSLSGSGSNNGNTASSSLPYPPGTPIVDNNSNNSRNNYQPGVFDHHLGVEGHKPFTELDDDFDDDDEEDLANNRREIVNINDSDNDSDFTSVSQRPPNPQYYGSNSGSGTGYLPSNVVNQYSHVQQYQPIHQQGMPPPPQPPQQQQYRPTGQYSPSPNMGYNNTPMRSGGGVPPPGAGPGPGPVPVSGSYFPNQGPVPVPPQQQQQVRGPTISENVLNNNPDFQFSRGGQQQKRRVNPGFVPVAARYNNNNNNSTTGSLIGGPGNKNQNASALMGRRENTGPRSGPYGITR